MTDLRADYPDYLRVESTVIPIAFIGGAGAQYAGFPYAVTSGAVLGPFNVAPWPSIQFFFQPATVDQRIVFTWYADAAGTTTIGTFNFNMRAGLPLAQIVRNMGPYLGVQVISAAGGAVGGSLWVGGSTRTLPGVAYQTSSFVVDWGTVSVGPGASRAVTMQYGYMGPAVLCASTGASKWFIQVQSTDILGNVRDVWQLTTAAKAVNVGVFLPALIHSVKIINASTATATFYAVLYQSQLP